MLETGLILMIDDEPTNLAVLGDILESCGYDVMAASSGEGGFELAKATPPTLILLDVNMPGGWDGYQTCREFKNHKLTANIPILFLSAQNSQENINHGFKAGGMDYIQKPFNREELTHRVKNHIELHNLRHHLEQEVIAKSQILSITHKELEQSYSESLSLLSVAGEYRDVDTGKHTYRIGEYSALLAQLVGWNPQQCNYIRLAAPLHDIGKIAIPDNILLKKGRLDEQEMSKMERHTIYGNEILLRHHISKSPHIATAAEIALCHHEKWNGSGYPNGLAGEDIPMSARITSLVDCYDALRSKRPYKDPFTHEKAVEIIIKGDGRTRPEHFDPELLVIFERFSYKFSNIYDSNAEKVDPVTRLVETD